MVSVVRVRAHNREQHGLRRAAAAAWRRQPHHAGRRAVARSSPLRRRDAPARCWRRAGAGAPRGEPHGGRVRPLSWLPFAGRRRCGGGCGVRARQLSWPAPRTVTHGGASARGTPAALNGCATHMPAAQRGGRCRAPCRRHAGRAPRRRACARVRAPGRAAEGASGSNNPPSHQRGGWTPCDALQPSRRRGPIRPIRRTRIDDVAMHYTRAC